MPRRMILSGTSKPQLRKAAKRDWSKAKATRFLSVLADTCNVSEACRRSKVPMTVAYRQRKRDAAFRAGWLDAIAVAYERLELVLLERAFNGTEKVILRKDGTEERMREYSNSFALQLLKLHRDTAIEAETEMPEDDLDALRKRLIGKFERMKARREGESVQEDPLDG